jgi:hypothetical protein
MNSPVTPGLALTIVLRTRAAISSRRLPEEWRVTRLVVGVDSALLRKIDIELSVFVIAGHHVG